MTETTNSDDASMMLPMSAKDSGAIVVVGLATGFVMWVVDWLADKFIIARMCAGLAETTCATVPTFIPSMSLIAGLIVALILLIRLRAYRPLLVVLAAAISLAGLIQSLHVLAWYQAASATVVLTALSFMLAAWLARVRNFWMSAVLIVVMVVSVRFVLFG